MSRTNYVPSHNTLTRYKVDGYEVFTWQQWFREGDGKVYFWFAIFTPRARVPLVTAWRLSPEGRDAVIKHCIANHIATRTLELERKES